MRIQLSLLLSIFCISISFAQVQTGKASFYADSFKGHKTASGERFNPKKFTAAHRQLPFGTKVRVTNLANNKSVVVRINDRGPFVSNRIIDLSPAAAKTLGFTDKGVTDVAIKVVDKDTKITGKLISEVDVSEKQAAQNSPQLDTAQKAPVKKLTKLKSTAVATKVSDSLTPPTAPRPIKDSTASKPIVSATHFYKVNIKKNTPTGYGVQIGSFSDGKNALTLAEQLSKSKYAPVTIEVKTIDQSAIYSLIIGQFDTHQKADDFKASILKKYPGCFVVNFAESAQ